MRRPVSHARATVPTMRTMGTRLHLIGTLWCTAACTHTPAPSELVGAQWWHGSGFDTAPRYVAQGRFVKRPAQPSETVRLPPLFAIPLAMADCAARRVAPQQLLSSQASLTEGEAADFYLSASDPRVGPPKPVAWVCGGRLVGQPPDD